MLQVVFDRPLLVRLPALVSRPSGGFVRFHRGPTDLPDGSTVPGCANGGGSSEPLERPRSGDAAACELQDTDTFLSDS